MDAHIKARTYSFVTLSTLIHVAMMIGVMFLKVQIEPSQKDLTQVEIISASQPASLPAISQAPIMAEIQKAEAKEEAIAPRLESPAMAANDEASPVVVAKSKKSIARHTKVKSAPAIHRAVAPPHSVPAPIPAELPVVENTDLESPVAEAQTDLKEEDIADDLSKIDQEQNAKVAAVHEDLNKETEEELKDQEAKLAALQKANEAESEKMAQENAAKRTKEKQELATQQQKAKATAAAAAMAALAASANQGKNTDDVRALEDLRQMPGNQRPQYDSQDRLNQRQGEVAFLAYVSREGAVMNFKMTKSSGHRELDAKTLKAIKNWKFYPGQEGWVEIPFKWDLKGGPQEMPTTLRRRAQVGQN